MKYLIDRAIDIDNLNYEGDFIESQAFGYLAVRHFLFGKERMFPIQFLDIYLKSIGGSGLVIYFQQGITDYREYATLGFFLLAALLSHFLARPEYKKIFFKR